MFFTILNLYDESDQVFMMQDSVSAPAQLLCSCWSVHSDAVMKM